MDYNKHFQDRIESEANPAVAQGIYADWLEENQVRDDNLHEILRASYKLRQSYPEGSEQEVNGNSPSPFFVLRQALCKWSEKRFHWMEERILLDKLRIPRLGINVLPSHYYEFVWKEPPKAFWAECAFRYTFCTLGNSYLKLNTVYSHRGQVSISFSRSPLLLLHADSEAVYETVLVDIIPQSNNKRPLAVFPSSEDYYAVWQSTTTIVKYTTKYVWW